MAVESVDPYKINVDERNERKENLKISELQKSVEERGVVDPPTVRERNSDAEVPYSVVIGQRRVLAAQAVGLDEIDVRVVDWDDTEALLNSITENIQDFQEQVSTSDRAKAIQRLKVENNWTTTDVAKKLGVTDTRVRQWLEPTSDEWEGTSLHVDYEDNKPELEGESISPDEIGEKKMTVIRQKVGGGEMGEELAKQVVQHDLSLHDTEEVAQRIERGQDVSDAVEQLSQIKQQAREEKLRKISTRVQFTGYLADGLESAAMDLGTSDEDVVRKAVEYYLDREGYL